MSSSKKKNVTPAQEQYQQLASKYEKKRPVVKNCIRAFIVGGFICLIGQGFNVFYYTFFDFTQTACLLQVCKSLDLLFGQRQPVLCGEIFHPPAAQRRGDQVIHHGNGDKWRESNQQGGEDNGERTGAFDGVHKIFRHCEGGVRPPEAIPSLLGSLA